MNLAAVLTALYPDALWGETNNDYATLVWDESNADPKPTLAELEAAWAQVQYDRAYAQVQQARQAAYQQTTDPIFFDWQRGEATEQDWTDAVQAVKDAHPYPAAP